MPGTTELESFIQAVAAATLDQGGVTAELHTYTLLPPIDAWSFPKYPARSIIISIEDNNLVDLLRTFIDRNQVFLLEPDCRLGTWINPNNQCYYLDIATSRPTLDEARTAAIAASQRESRPIVALYNSLRGETVYLG